MLAFSAYDRYGLQTGGLAGPMRNSTFARYRSAEAAAEERIRAQREARLRQPRTNTSPSANVPFIGSARFPQRWTDE